MKVKVINVHNRAEPRTFEGDEDSVKNQLFAQYPVLRGMPDHSLIGMVDALNARQSYLADIDADAAEMERMIQSFDTSTGVHSADAPEPLTPALEGCSALPEGLRDFWVPEDD